MPWIEAFHIIFMVCWFAGIFYLPRLFVYHAMAEDPISQDRFKIMERKLYYGIATPSAILTIIFGLWLLHFNAQYYLHALWLQIKLALVGILVVYHIVCGKYLYDFKHNKNRHSHVFYRIFNEFPVIILVAVVILVVVKP